MWTAEPTKPLGGYGWGSKGATVQRPRTATVGPTSRHRLWEDRLIRTYPEDRHRGGPQFYPLVSCGKEYAEAQ